MENMRADEGRQMDAAGKMPAVQGGYSEEKMQRQSNLRSEEGLRFLAAEKRPAVQGGDSKEEMEMPSNRRSEEGLRFFAAEKRPALGGDSKEETEIPSNRRSYEGLQLHATGQGPDVQGGDADEVGWEVLRILLRNMGDQKEKLAKLLKYEEENQLQKQEIQRQKQKVLQGLIHSMQPSDKKKMWGKLLEFAEEDQQQKQENQGEEQKVLQGLMHSMQLSDQKEMLAKLLKYEEENQLQKQEIQQQKQKVLQGLIHSMQPSDKKKMWGKLLEYAEEDQQQKQENQGEEQKVLQGLMHSMQLSDQKEMLAKLLKHAEEKQPQKQENQQQKQNKKHHHRKSRLALRKIALDKVKRSNVEKPPSEDKAAAYLTKWAKEREAEPESESRSDRHAYHARLCRDRWNESFAAAGHYGTYESITSIPPMRFTDYVDASAGPCETLQIFSVRVVGVKEEVEWPLYVYGKLAVRDTVDHKRNIIFDRRRDNFQTVTEEDPYLTLTGPCRAAVLSVRHSYIEAELKIKGSSSDSSDDKDFSYLAAGYIQTAPFESYIEKRVLSSRISTLELTVGHIANSVEATIFVVVSSGRWPSGHGGAFTVSTGSLGAMEIVLLTFGDDGLPLEVGGKNIRLSRRVVGVEVDGRLNLSVKASPLPVGSSKIVLSDEKFVTPKEAGKSHLMLKVGSCEMEVTVAWSLLLTYDR